MKPLKMKPLNRIVAALVAVHVAFLPVVLAGAACAQDTTVNINIGLGGDDGGFGLFGGLLLLGMMAMANRPSGGGLGGGTSTPQYRRLPPLQIAVEQHAKFPSVAILPEERTIYCMPGTMLSIYGSPPDDSYIPPALEADRRRVSIDHAAVIQGDYLFYWQATEPGEHLLRVLYTPRDGASANPIRTVHVIVTDTAPVSLTAVPPTADTDTQITIARTTTAAFKPVRSEVVMDAGDFDLAADRASLAIPASKMPPGTYSLSVASYTADGTRFVTMPRTMRILHPAAPLAAPIAPSGKDATISSDPAGK